MNSKKANKFLNKMIILLVVLIAFVYGKQYYDKTSYAFSDKSNEKEVLSKSDLEIYFFDVGQADSILIKNNDDVVLIDAGNRSDGENLVKYIKDELNVDSFDMVVGTHPHEDHVGGMSYIVDSFDIKKLYLPDAISSSKYFEKLLDSIEKKNYEISIPEINQKISIGEMNFEVLYTSSDESDLNNTSIVLKLTYGNTSYLFMGDAPTKAEKKILDKDIDVDVLKVGHHGSKYSSGKEFLKKVSPTYSIIQVGKNNKYKHPSENTLEKLESIGSKVYRTDIDGTIKIVSDGKDITISKLDTSIDG